ncbi:MAG TPA: NAD(P)/FAD-dependent oxidoreductase [Solirubrobacterales bacterium]|nr:NAD(P)/FAD-dependent oxidoreductase [Solirubrobacterales bacterium]
MSKEFDVIVIGAGPAGEVLAGRIGDRGERSVAIVERELIGGECSFYACMPSKALLRPAEAIAEARRVPGAAEAVTGDLDVGAVLARRDEVIHDLDDSGQLPWLEDRGIELFRVHGRLEGERRVRIGDAVYEAKDAVVIATGTGAVMPPIPGLDEASAWSNREITTAKEVPESLVVLGGGVVGVEMAQAWSSLGSSVALIEAEDELLPREEAFAGAALRESLTERGVDVHVGAKAASVSRDGDMIEVELEGGRKLSGERLLVAVGRKPRTEDLGLSSVGLEDGGYIEVDDQLRVEGSDWLYAIGDVNGRSLLTHSGKYQGRLAADHIEGREVRAVNDGDDAPRVIFTDPQIAAVGLTEALAKDAGTDLEVVDLSTEGTAGGSFYGHGAGGTTRFIVDAEREVLVGATFVGPEVADMLQAATIAVAAAVPLATLANAVPPFPTRSELWLKFLEEYEKARPGANVHSRGR